MDAETLHFSASYCGVDTTHDINLSHETNVNVPRMMMSIVLMNDGEITKLISGAILQVVVNDLKHQGETS